MLCGLVSFVFLFIYNICSRININSFVRYCSVIESEYTVEVKDIFIKSFFLEGFPPKWLS